MASSSPRRRALLRQIGLEPDSVFAPNIDETVTDKELPRDYVRRMARQKLEHACAKIGETGFVLAADTVVACGRRILGKPQTLAEAKRFLSLLSGRRHRVMTAIAAHGPDGRRSAKLVTTMVRFKRLSDADKSWYLKSGEWQDKAGGYAIQGYAALFVPAINGSYSNVVGLPLNETIACLEGLGFQRPIVPNRQSLPA